MKLEVRDLSATLQGRTVLQGLDLEMRTGEVTAVIGPNGAGKSTLLRIVAGLMPAARGSVLLDSLPLAHWTRGDLARVLAYVPQERTVHWSLTVRNVVGLGRLPFQSQGAAETPDDAAAVHRALADMDVLALADRSVRDISGGELARVLIARALAQEPAILLADEPAAGLDPAHQLALFRCFARLASSGRSVVLALHDLTLAARFCHSAVLLREGSVVAAGTPEYVLDSRYLRAAYGVEGQLRVIDGMPVVLVRDELP